MLELKADSSQALKQSFEKTMMEIDLTCDEDMGPL